MLQKEKASVASKKNDFAKSRMKEVEIKGKIVDRNRYAQTVNERSLDLARTAKIKAGKSKQSVVAALTGM